MTLDRTGSNHLLASLHYQEGLFSFREGLVFPLVFRDSDNRVLGDAEMFNWFRGPNSKCSNRTNTKYGSGKNRRIGGRPAIDEIANAKFQAADYYVWKIDYRDLKDTVDYSKRICHFIRANTCYSKEYLSLQEDYLNHFNDGDLLIFHLRHPHSVLESHHREWGDASKNYEDLISDFEVIFGEIYKASKNKNIRIHTNFHERMIENYNDAMEKIMNNLDLGNNRIHDYYDYFQAFEKITGIKEIPMGPQKYQPARIIEFKDVCEKIKGKQRVIEDIYGRCKDKYPSEQLEEFKNFYTNLHNRI